MSWTAMVNVILEHKSKTFLSSTVYKSTKQLVHFFHLIICHDYIAQGKVATFFPSWKIKYYCPAMHSSGPLIAMLATKFNCFPLYLPRRGNKSIRWKKKSEFSCCTNTIFWRQRNTMRKVARLPKPKHHLRLSHVPIHANPHQSVTLTNWKSWPIATVAL